LPGRGPAAAAPAGGAGAGRGGRGGLPGAGQQSDVFQRPTDVAWDSAGNIYVADGFGNSRIAKFDKTGKFVKSWGSRGSENGQFNMIHGIVVDAQGNVYVADTANKRIQVFDREGTFKTQLVNAGSPAAICITPGAHQYLYSSNSNPPEDIDSGGEIYKMELDGRIVGKFGKAGKPMKEFGNWRVQKLTLHAK
jgi:DNA-binding beta-propeller fold protein YncE